MGKISNLQRAESSSRTELEVSMNVNNLESLAHLITCANALTGELRGGIAAQSGVVHVVFKFKEYQGHMDFYNICLSLPR